MAEYIPLLLMVFIISLLGTVTLEQKLIPCLSKRAQQPIYEDGPSWHMKKRGTPTMGGVAFLVAITLSLLVASLILAATDMKYEAASVIVVILFAVFNSLVGIIDDLTKLRRKENAGLSPLQKLVFQFISAAVFLFVREYFFSDGTSVNVGDFSFNLNLLYYPVMAVMLVGIINCANLTDGVDGLATCTAIGVGAALLFMATSVDTALISIALIGGAIAFLFFNINPAKIFMGDTGSLFFGALTAYAAFTLETPMLIVLISSVYVIEGVSVIMQVVFYKITKRRIFKMSPLHHHLEKCGWGETKICLCALILTLLSSLVAFGITLL